MSQKRIRGLAIHRPIVYGNTAWRMTDEERGDSDHTHRWNLCVRSAAAPEPTEEQLSGLEPPTIGGADDLGYFIKRVTFKLHETYPNSLRTIDRPPFEVSETGWGEFEVQIRIFFINEAGEKPLGPFTHFVKLHPWTAVVLTAPNNLKPPPHMVPPPQPPNKEEEKPAEPGSAADDASSQVADSSDVMTVDKATEPAAPEHSAAAGDAGTDGAAVTSDAANGVREESEVPVIIDSPVHSYQYDEIVFNEPTEAFYNLLTSFPPTQLPKKPRLPKPDPAIPLGAVGNVGELTQDTERIEGERLDYARLQTLAQVDTMRRKIDEHEKLLEQLQAARDAAVAA